jgi:hypothetical protein
MRLFLLCFSLAACRQLPTEAELAACSRMKLERELTGPVQLRGSAVENGRLKPGTYLFSSTYLALRTDAAGQRRFNEVMGPIQRRLDTQPGLLCAVARTFSVWADEAPMYSFVGSERSGSHHSLRLRQSSAHPTHVDHRFRDEADRAFHAKSITRAMVTSRWIVPSPDGIEPA